MKKKKIRCNYILQLILFFYIKILLQNNNNPNTKYKGAYSGKRKLYTGIQGFNPKTNFRTPIFTNLREASNWMTPEGKDIKPRTLVRYLNKKITYKNYLWTAKLVTGEEYQDIIST